MSDDSVMGVDFNSALFDRAPDAVVASIVSATVQLVNTVRRDGWDGYSVKTVTRPDGGISVNFLKSDGCA